jgi:hypothetical protein
MNNCHKGHSIDDSYLCRFIWPSGFREEDILEIDKAETRIAYGGHVC